MDNLNYRQWQALKDLFGFYCLWKLKKWRMVTRWNDIAPEDYESLATIGFAAKNESIRVGVQRLKSSPKWHERQSAKFVELLLEVFKVRGDQYQITLQGIYYCFEHGVHFWRDTLG